MSRKRRLPLIGMFSPNGAFLREPTIREVPKARPIVYLRGRQRLCGDCAAKAKGNGFHRAPLSRKAGYEVCTRCEQPIAEF